jgi:hypothetical protein
MNRRYNKKYNGSFIGNGKASGMIDFFNYLIEKNIVDICVARCIRLTAVTVLQTVEDPDKWDDIDIETININNYICRFKNLTENKYTPGSFRAHISNFKRAIRLYRQFLLNARWNYILHGYNKSAVKKSGARGLFDDAILLSNNFTHYPMILDSQDIFILKLPSLITEDERNRLCYLIDSLLVIKNNHNTMF